MAFAVAAVLNMLINLDAAESASYCIVIDRIKRDRSFYCFCRGT
jgi:hypothetical protein